MRTDTTYYLTRNRSMNHMYVCSIEISSLAAVGTLAFGAGPPDRPNIVYIVADDLDAQSIAYMPRLQSLLVDQGLTFANAFVTTSVCCPSQTSMLTGKYAHNHQIKFNIPPLGGFQKFKDMGGESSTIAT